MSDVAVDNSDDGRTLSRAGQPAFAVRINRSRDNAARSDRVLAWVTGPPLKALKNAV